jgi:Cu(I)/Ag(I) efflux system membrane protein CusA/SilA
MFLYLDLACEQAKRENLRLTKGCPYEAIVEGAAKRLRPKFISFATMTIGLVPIL